MSGKAMINMDPQKDIGVHVGSNVHGFRVTYAVSDEVRGVRRVCVVGEGLPEWKKGQIPFTFHSEEDFLKYLHEQRPHAPE